MSAVGALNLIDRISVSMKIDYRRISAVQCQRRSHSTIYNWEYNKIILVHTYLPINKMKYDLLSQFRVLKFDMASDRAKLFYFMRCS